MCVCVCVCVLKPSTREGCDTRPIFNWSLTGSNSKFSYSETGCYIYQG